MQKRVVFFVHDGSGLGHLRRCARIAEALQGPCACLIVTGHRAAAWIVPPQCEFLYVPSWDSFFEIRSSYWQRRPWLALPLHNASALRRGLLDDILRRFQPDALIVDYLPLGLHDELRLYLGNATCVKYFLLRGIIDEEDQAQFSETYAGVLERFYDRILVAADPSIVDISEYGLPSTLISKTTYIGYVLPAHGGDSETTRQRQRVPPGTTWVVCSGGGGFRAETFLAECVRISGACPDVRFDIVFGPRSSVVDPRSPYENCAVWNERPDLPDLHAAADVVVTSGGYNSLMEAMCGGAHLVVCARPGAADEPWQHARRWAKWYPVTVACELSQLAASVRTAAATATTATARPQFPFATNATDVVREIVYRDLGVTQ